MQAIAATGSVGGSSSSDRAQFERTSRPPGFVEIIKDEVRSRTTRAGGFFSITQFMPTLIQLQQVVLLYGRFAVIDEGSFLVSKTCRTCFGGANVGILILAS